MDRKSEYLYSSNKFFDVCGWIPTGPIGTIGPDIQPNLSSYMMRPKPLSAQFRPRLLSRCAAAAPIPSLLLRRRNESASLLRAGGQQIKVCCSGLGSSPYRLLAEVNSPSLYLMACNSARCRRLTRIYSTVRVDSPLLSAATIHAATRVRVPGRDYRYAYI